MAADNSGTDGEGSDVKQVPVPASISCSVCLEIITEAGERSVAKLKCGHDFHLDCIGSAFNAKGVMQCPNCRQVEHGQWLYANGCCLQEDFMEDITYEDDYEVYGGMPNLVSHPDEMDDALDRWFSPASDSDIWWRHVQVQRSYTTTKGGSKWWICN